MVQEIKNLFKFRELILALLIRGFKAKYKNSFLGIFWSLLNPLLNVLIFTFIFTVIIKINIKSYPLYLLCTIFPWNFFNSALINSIVSIVEDDHFVKNTFFPYEVIPLAVVITNFINFLIDLLILIPVLLLFGRGISIVWFYIPLLIFIGFILTCGLSILAAGIYVTFRDLNFILNFSLRLFFYFVPVIYTLDFIPQKLRSIYLCNPLAAVIDGFAKVLFYGRAPDLKWLGLATLESIIIFTLCFYAFQKIKKALPEQL
ncbi:MAG: hypothetical protein A2166_00030 [Omnitrophica WOR_2 bacterium RBG_13_41_10]|nr:MAG: hypothetical protein A2166_00030 [Omnitrophica WOR_2 bacterium RBG_13_41_10]